MNAFIAQAGDRLPVEFKLTGIRPQPWTPDVALLRTQTAMPTADALAELRLARQRRATRRRRGQSRARPSPYRELVVPDGRGPVARSTPKSIAALRGLRTGTRAARRCCRSTARWADALPSENLGVQENSPGSNNWVVSGALTAQRATSIVANDPHRNVANPSIRYIVHLNAPGWNVIGATEPPLPGVLIGHNGRIAWGLTIVGTDQSDVYVEEVNPANRNQVRFRGALGAAAHRARHDPREGRGTGRWSSSSSRATGPMFYEDTVRTPRVRDALDHARAGQRRLSQRAPLPRARRLHGNSSTRSATTRRRPRT